MNDALEPKLPVPRAQRVLEWVIGGLIVIVMLMMGEGVFGERQKVAATEHHADAQVVAECEDLADIARRGAI